MRARVPLIVCGEPTRGDDAAGPAVVALLAADVRARVAVLDVGQLDVQVLLDLPADVPCVVVDAVAGLAPGEIWVRPLATLVDLARGRAGSPGEPGGAAGEPGGAAGRPVPRSSHELPPDQVLALAAALRDEPPAGTFVGIGGSCWDAGAPLSPPVLAGLPAFAAAIGGAVAALAGSGAPARPGYSG